MWVSDHISIVHSFVFPFIQPHLLRSTFFPSTLKCQRAIKRQKGISNHMPKPRKFLISYLFCNGSHFDLANIHLDILISVTCIFLYSSTLVVQQTAPCYNRGLINNHGLTYSAFDLNWYVSVEYSKSELFPFIIQIVYLNIRVCGYRIFDVK